MNNDFFNKKNILALTTAVVSIMIGVIYLALVFALDLRGPMIPPPSEALISVVAFSNSFQLADQ